MGVALYVNLFSEDEDRELENPPRTAPAPRLMARAGDSGIHCLRRLWVVACPLDLVSWFCVCEFVSVFVWCGGEDLLARVSCCFSFLSAGRRWGKQPAGPL